MLPEVGTEDENEFGNINDSVDFLLSNFIEMNKLWVRMQYQGHNISQYFVNLTIGSCSGSKMDQEKRESERKMLQDLVGKNLTYLSQLDALDFNLYSSSVLEKVCFHCFLIKANLSLSFIDHWPSHQL